MKPATDKGRLAPRDTKGLIQAAHRDPHAHLGMHPLPDGGVVVRALRPDADGVWVVLDDGGPEHPMARVHPGGLFEVVLPELEAVTGYRLHVRTTDRRDLVLRDPYTFLPSLGELDVFLAGEGRHEELYHRLGAHVTDQGGVPGTTFAVWAPNAAAVSVVGDWNAWDPRLHQMRALGASGIWEIFIPGLGPGDYYRYAIRRPSGKIDLRSDPVAFAAETRPRVASRIVDLEGYAWGDDTWMHERASRDPYAAPLAIYEVHLGSWMRTPTGEFLNYRDLAHRLVAYVKDLGFTHLELLPVAEYPFDGSWGYQVTGYFAPTSRFGSPHDFMYFVDHCHRNGIGVLLDWVPAHFPKDEFALARFDGTELYEHADPRQGEHPDWGTLVFNYGRHEVRNFLISSAVFWLDRYHIDGFRVDAVASMLYLDYSRGPGEWVPNRYGGRENLEALEFLKEFNAVVRRRFPGVLTVAEESTSWAGVTRSETEGGLGFGAMWDMGFMHDMLAFFREDPFFRKHHQGKLTFRMLYAFNERYVLPFSHDEVVHGKGSMVAKMPGDEWQKFANLRALYAYMFAQPGKKLLFMGNEFGPWTEWSHERELEWGVLEHKTHRGLRDLVRRLAGLYREEPALWQNDADWQGFEWIDFSDAEQNVVSFIRRGKDAGQFLVCVFNFSPAPRRDYVVGVPRAAYYDEILNSDAAEYAGSGLGNLGRVDVLPTAAHGQEASVRLLLPPLSGIYLKPGPGPAR